MAVYGYRHNFSEETWEQLNDMMEITDCSKDGVCSNCGQCCNNNLPMNFQEVEKIRKYVKKHNIQPCAHFAPLAGFAGDMICPFRDNVAKRCTIYPVRPKICRSFFCGDTREKLVADRREAFRLCSMEVDMRATFFGEVRK